MSTDIAISKVIPNDSLGKLGRSGAMVSLVPAQPLANELSEDQIPIGRSGQQQGT